MQLETKIRVKSFEMIGWADPDDGKIVKASKWFKSLSHENWIYEAETFSADTPPPVIFYPEEHLMNKMIESVARHPGNTDALLVKYCDFLPPKPAWMIEQDKLKQQLTKMATNVVEEICSSNDLDR